MPLAENLRGKLVAGDIRSPLRRRDHATHRNELTAEDLNGFEQEVAEAFNAGKIRAPVHLSGGNEEKLIDLFRLFISHDDWIFCTYRNHHLALLHDIPRERVMDEILAGRSQNLSFPEHRFLASAMVGGILPIAVGVALALKRKSEHSRNVWCFIGDMAATTGAFAEARYYAGGHDLPINFVVEDNGMSCDSPTKACWGSGLPKPFTRYVYERRWPHINTGKWITFK